jgi:protein ImuB
MAKRGPDDLVARLAAEAGVCVRWVVIVETEHGERSERVWYREHGLSASAIVERTRWQLEGWASGPDGLSGGVELVRLLPDEVHSDDGLQAGLWGGRSLADEAAARAVVRLTGLAGEQAVTVPAWEGGRLPSDRYRRVPAVSVDLDDHDRRLDHGDAPWPGSTPAPSPTVVLDEPQPVEVFDLGGAPVGVSGRGEVSAAPVALVIGGRRQQIVAWAGPWPVEQRWWASDRSRRVARFQVVTDRGVAHLLGVEQQRWSILGTYA